MDKKQLLSTLKVNKLMEILMKMESLNKKQVSLVKQPQKVWRVQDDGNIQEESS